MTSTDARGSNEARLVRALGVRSLATTIFNYTVGSGIFVLPALAVARLGAAAPLAYLVCMLVMGLVLLCLAEAGSRIAITGGVYAYVETALGPFIGFIAGVALLFVGVFGGAAVAVLFSRTVIAMLGLTSQVWYVPLILAVIALFTLINVRGVRNSARTMEFITLVKIVPLIAFALIGAAFVHRSNLTWDHAPTLTAVLGTSGLVIFAFTGIESALAPSGEVRSPWRTVPRAAFLALAAATALYLAIQWVALGIEGTALGADTVTPLARAAGGFAGPLGRNLMIVAATISMLGYLSANVLSTPRSIFAYARDGFLPASLYAVHERFRTPHVAIIVHGVLIAALALSGTYEHLAIYSNLNAFVLYMLCAIAVLVLRARDVQSGGPPFRIPGGPLIPIAALIANAWLLYVTAARGDLIGLSVILGLALLLYAVRQWRRALPLPR
ncbi:MAG TPA: amino acid permease [Steroidobacteraceae bacterium]|jgi:amino acid transporter